MCFVDIHEGEGRMSKEVGGGGGQGGVLWITERLQKAVINHLMLFKRP